jgi:hypothetical protein
MKEFKNAIFYFSFKLMQVMLARNESQMGLCLGKDCIFKTKSGSDFKHYFHIVFFPISKKNYFWNFISISCYASKTIWLI